MAILTATQLADIRVPWSNELAGCRLNKPLMNAVAQAVEDTMRSGTLQTALSNAIDAASAPFGVTLTATEKRLAMRWWLRNFYERGAQ